MKVVNLTNKEKKFANSFTDDINIHEDTLTILSFSLL